MSTTDRLPVTLITGALGSGKTTLLRKLLAHPKLGETAVLVNEIGEIGIDHHLLRQVDERTVLLGNGCVCCSIRGDLADELRDLLSRRERGEIPSFDRVMVETSGLADPVPILYTLLSEPVVKHHFEPEVIVTTVDGVNGVTLTEAEKQVAVADTLVVTKTDIARPADVRDLEQRLNGLNPEAQVLEVAFGDVEPDRLLSRRTHDPRGLAVAGGEAAESHNFSAFVLFVEQEIDWTAFGIWLTMLLASRGEDVLRVKGFLNVGATGPLLLNGVQHVVHPPVHLDGWPDDDRRSRLVFVTRGIEKGAVETSLAAFNAAGHPRALADQASDGPGRAG